MAHLEALASTPRPAGSAAVTQARDYCAIHLRSIGFIVTERPFEYSALPGRFGAPIIGGVTATMLSAASALGALGRTVECMTLLATTLVTTGLLARWLGGVDGTRSRFLRHSGVNLEAVRGANPRVWLIAHIDSKSQPVSTAVRTTAVVLLVLSFIAATICSVLGAVIGLSPAAWIATGVLALAGGIPLVASTVGSGSDGAADNASGVAAVLEATSLVSPGKSFGVVITDAEELALAGARAWVLDRESSIAINCDTVDDDGHLVVMQYDGLGSQLARKSVDAARTEDALARVIRPLPGVLTDSVAFRDANWSTVTLSCGTVRTLNRIHTKRDNLHSMRGTGIPAAARVLARLVEELA